MSGTTRRIPSPVFSQTSTLRNAARYTVYIARIPARAVLIVSAVILLLSSVFLCAMGWIVVEKIERQISNFQRLAMFFHVFNYTFVSVSSIVGLHAGIRNKRKASQLFTGLLLGQILFGITSGAICLRFLFSAASSAEQVTECAALVQTALWGNHICARSPLMKGLVSVAFFFSWTLEILAVYSGMRFTRQLQEQELLKEFSSDSHDSMYGY